MGISYNSHCSKEDMFTELEELCEKYSVSQSQAIAPTYIHTILPKQGTKIL